jgi:hypothetical protein
MDENKNIPSHESSELPSDSSADESGSSKMSNEAFESLKTAFMSRSDRQHEVGDLARPLSADDRKAIASRLAMSATDQNRDIQQGANLSVDKLLRIDQKLPNLSIVGLDNLPAPKKQGTDGGGKGGDKRSR